MMKKQLIFILLITSVSCFAAKESVVSPFEGYVEGLEENKDFSPLAAVGSGFNYQGELLDSGAAANTHFDFAFQLYDALTGGSQVGSTVIKGNRPVVDGLFSIEGIDFGDAVYTGDELWLTVTVRETGNPGSETALTPRQKINAVPYAVQADYLGPIGASNGDILKFTGGAWAPSSAGGESPWTINGSMIYYTDGRVGIGRTNPAVMLHVDTPTSTPAIFNGGSGAYTVFAENGVNRGYIGSFQNSATPGINDEDFEIGTYSSSVGSLHLVTGVNDPRLTVNSSGDVGIRTVSPAADLMIDADDLDDALRVRVNLTTKFFVDENGGTGIGSWSKPPTNGLVVSGDIEAKSKVTALDSGDADMKAYVYGFVNSTATVVLGSSSDGFTVSKTSTGVYKINFIDTSINQNYMVVANTNSSSPKFTSVVKGLDEFDIHVWDTNGNHTDHAFQFVVYRK